jgi:CIC family chloride channel protein
VLAADADLEEALKLMESTHEEHIAVLSDLEDRRMVGIVHQVDVMLAYNRALLRVHREEHGVL